MTGFNSLEECITEVLHRHLLAVVEDDIVPNFDGHAQAIGRKLPFGEQAWDQFERWILVEQLIEDHFEDGLRIRREPLVGVPGRNVGWPTDRYGIGPLRPRSRGAG